MYKNFANKLTIVHNSRSYLATKKLVYSTYVICTFKRYHLNLLGNLTIIIIIDLFLKAINPLFSNCMYTVLPKYCYNINI